MKEIISKLLDTLGKLFGLGDKLVDPAQYDIKVMKLLRRKCEYGETYMRIDNEMVPYDDISEERKTKLKMKYFRKFLDMDV